MSPSKCSVDKKAASSRPSQSASRSTQTKVSTRLTPLQSHLLALFPLAFPHIVSAGSDDAKQRIQRLKQALYAQALGTAFVDAEAGDLDAYAFRWSPTRALGYHALFCSRDTRAILRNALFAGESVRWGRTPANNEKVIKDHESAAEISKEIEQLSLNDEQDEAGKMRERAVKVVALGGGAGAEVVAIAGMLKDDHLSSPSGHANDRVAAEDATTQKDSGYHIHLHVLDIAPWQPVLSALRSALFTSIQPTPGTTSAPAPLLSPDALALTFNQCDVLALHPTELSAQVKGAKLVTILFTLNELYAASKGRTTALLLHLTDILQPGAVLMVVDSAGSYAAVDVGGAEQSGAQGKSIGAGMGQGKTYPMHFLLDHTLLEVASSVNQSPHNERGGEHARKKKRRRWDKVYEEKARWFRLPQDVEYPLIDLEDMRMQVHCYERV